MLADIEKVIALLRQWKLHPDIHVYAWRFAIQKLAYLANALGLPLNYCFNLYLNGPYSPALARDYYDQEVAVTSLKSSYELTSSDTEILQKLQEIAFDGESINWERVRDHLTLLESLATAVFLKVHTADIKDEEIFALVKRLKPYLSDAVVVIGRNKAKALLFQPSFLTPEIKKELEEWDQIDTGGNKILENKKVQ